MYVFFLPGTMLMLSQLLLLKSTTKYFYQATPIWTHSALYKLFYRNYRWFLWGAGGRIKRRNSKYFIKKAVISSLAMMFSLGTLIYHFFEDLRTCKGTVQNLNQPLPTSREHL